MPGMSPRQKLKKGRFGNSSPVLIITGGDATPSIGANPNTSFTATATDAQLGDLTAAITWSIVSAFAIPASAGAHTVNVGGVRVGGDATGLTNDATVYTAAVVVDGGASQPITVTGTAAQTYTTLLAELNADTTGAVWSIVGGDVVCISDITGASSTIAITDTDLFLTLTDYVVLFAAVPGANLVPEATAAAGTGGNPSITFLITGAQNVYAEVTDGALVDTATRATTVIA